MHKSHSILFLFVLAAACASIDPSLHREATLNREKLNHVHVGQTLDEVRAIMGNEPERRDARKRFDGKVVELWSYATDYVRRLDTTITFIDGRVEEIKTSTWYDPD
jgi:hypothetical protein